MLRYGVLRKAASNKYHRKNVDVLLRVMITARINELWLPILSQKVSKYSLLSFLFILLLILDIYSFH